jgi:extracellular factor (EF) 3-hydroxypalmitic acid methyl ester biosynthesis protein
MKIQKRNPIDSGNTLSSQPNVVPHPAAADFLRPVLARHHGIRSSFKEYTANLNHDLGEYRDFFDHLDARGEGLSEGPSASIGQAVIDYKGRVFKKFLDSRLDELNTIVSGFSIGEHQQHGTYFRKQLWDFILCCPLFARTNLKPRGYAGDYEMMRMIYQNRYLGDTTFSKLMHKHSVEHAAAQSVRNRITLIEQMLNSFCEKSCDASPRVFRILSVGSGPAFELEHILKSPADCRTRRFVLLDQDPLALAEAARMVDALGEKIGTPPAVEYLNASVRNLIFSRHLQERWGKFDYIYSMGLFDYLSPQVAKALLKRLIRLLAPDGEMMIGNFHVCNPSRYYMEYWCDWFLCHRTEEEFVDLVDQSLPASVSILFESTGSQMFLRVKNGDILDC